MENENFTLRTNDRFGFDVEVHDHKDQVWLTLDPNDMNGRRAVQRLTPEQARLLATALNRFADKV